ncbi:flagellar protein FliO/FliZ [Anaerosporobacter mobilis DSM 15930]|uniref:Flagellar protein FliO/FliZ n=1 Tax=Anaerosporobacter mobilis DSM 15930 TaxID=1120996 RepID=A0A1M7EXJ4_9FIRM|nr:flagellar biosynthetic protein FliO [Anaerosporobacter mobilis]SHL96413.1 flagellar protein FliO/FliZ [Anaerosporobacter mobilis DSM 15930]
MIAKNYLFQGSSTIRNIAELFGLLLVFVLILVLAYYTSKWIGKTGAGMTTKNHNITIIETLRLSQTKYLQIIKIANKYIVIAVSKDHVEYLTDIDGDQLKSFEGVMDTPSFKEVLSKIKLGTNVKSKDCIENEKDENDV